MDVTVKGNKQSELEEMMGIRKGPWTLEEDTILVNYIATYGEGRWNSVARSAGLRRTGKSCRLRWLNYLRPDVRRGNITLQEQLLILDLHSRWGNRWSKIAQHLPGRTDNEIKNYWRTRVIKQAKQLKCDVNSKQFRDAMRYVWMPRLLERIRASSEYHRTQPLTSPAQKELDPSGVFHYYRGTEWGNPNQTSSESSMELQVHSISNSDHSEQYSEMMGVENGSDLSFNNELVYEQGNNNGTIGGGGGGDSLESMWNEGNMWFFDELVIKDSFIA